jgi:hypothetical protein
MPIPLTDPFMAKTPGWQIEKLGQGSHAGQGWVLREYTPAGNPTGRMVTIQVVLT